MKNDLIFLADDFLAHPVLINLGIGPDQRTDTFADGDLERTRLIVVDCRQIGKDDGRNPIRKLGKAVKAHVPILFLDPAEIHLEAISQLTPIVDRTASRAMLLLSQDRADGMPHFHTETLTLPAVTVDSDQGTSLSGIAEKRGSELDQIADGCDCEIDAGGTAWSPFSAGVDHFSSVIRKVLSGQNVIPQVNENNPPTGVIYFLMTKNLTPINFEYEVKDGKKNKTDGSITTSMTIWGFLSQTQTSNTQYLVINSDNQLYPGELRHDGSKDRGIVDVYFKVQLEAPMSKKEYVPAGATCSTFTGDVSLPISYESPTGGYQIWTFEDSVNYSVDKWCIESANTSEALGGMWYMKSPCNGSNLGSSWKNAFDTWGKVESMSGGSKGTLNVKSIAVWSSTTLLKGNQRIDIDYEWQGARFWSSSCGAGVCLKIHYASETLWDGQSFTVDFNPINPS